MGVSSSGRQLGRTVQTLAIAAVLLAATWLANEFVWVYLFSAALFALICIRAHPRVRPVFIFLAVYLLIALPNISRWRGTIEPYTAKMYATCLLALYVPLAALPRRLDLRVQRLRLTPLLRQALTCHLSCVVAAVVYVYATNGTILLDQELRFGISPLYGYIARSSSALAAFAPFFFRGRWKQALCVAAAVLPSVLLGARGTAVLALVSYAICWLWVRRASGARLHISRRTAVLAVGVLGLLVVAQGFYVRRSSGQLATAAEVAARYFEYDSWWIYVVMPLHLGFRETVGLSNRIITEQIANDMTEAPLFFADLYTVLPGEQVAAGQALAGKLGGAFQAGGLTPGLLGGLYIDYQERAVLFFLAIGAMIAWSVRRASASARFVPVYSLILVQLIHLFHRGFLKPEYITTLSIAFVYAFLARVVMEQPKP